MTQRESLYLFVYLYLDYFLQTKKNVVNVPGINITENSFLPSELT